MMRRYSHPRTFTAGCDQYFFPLDEGQRLDHHALATAIGSLM
jgi:hypothetical protein